MLLGSMSVNAARKTLVKLTPDAFITWWNMQWLHFKQNDHWTEYVVISIVIF